MSLLLVSPKNVYITKRLLDEAALANIKVENFSIQELADRQFDVDINRYDCLYIRFCYPYFEQTIELAKKFLAAGKKVADADIASGDVGLGKMPPYKILAEAGIPSPKTEWLTRAKQWQYPCVVKWAYGFGGKEVFVVKNSAELKRTTEFLPVEELLMQEFIPAKYEYKVVTVGYKSLPVVLRFLIDKTTFRPAFNSAVPVHVPSGDPKIRAVVALAEKSSALLKRELAKTDILESQGKFYVLEVNRWPGLKSFEELTGYNAVGEFLKYLIKS